uniref:Uncharacterized protein n=1 Tax=Iridovirus Liz-CrIV TaxID=2594309 RepID=A0A5B8RKT5_9VIRU|nr:putative protein 249R [Iridovirus Liz-CrIV]
MKELIFFFLIIVILFIIFMVVSSKQTKTFGRNEEPFLQIKNNLGWGGCGLTNWF